MNDTPFFPEWRQRMASARRQTANHLRQNTIPQLDERLTAIVPVDTLGQEKDKDHSRSRIFTFRLTFECFLWQLLNPGTACREVVRRVQAMRRLSNQSIPDESTGAYVQSRLKIKEDRIRDIMNLTGEVLETRACKPSLLQGRPVKVVDGSSTKLPDTRANQKEYPQPSVQKKGCGFPVMKFLVLFSLQTGAVLRVVMHSLHAHDLRLFRSLWDEFQPGDICLGDRAFGEYLTLAMLPRRQVDVVARLHQTRKADLRKGRRLGKNDCLFTWNRRESPSKHLPAHEWAQVPKQIVVRVIRFTVASKGFRSGRITLVTTLLDPELYPAWEVQALYLRRWRIELCLRDLKTTLGMEELRCKSPSMARKELLTYLIAHNLIRGIILSAAYHHETDIEHLSFKGSIDALRQYESAAREARSVKTRTELWRDLLLNIARDNIPCRPGRREPRAIKRRRKPYAMLTKPRHSFRETAHRNNYRAKQ